MIKPEWDDIAVVHERMRQRKLLDVRAKPGSIAGHILCMCTFGRAARRAGGYVGALQLLRDYADWKRIPEGELVRCIEAHWGRTGHLRKPALELVEELSRI